MFENGSSAMKMRGCEHEGPRERDPLTHAGAEFVGILRGGAEREHQLVEERRHAHRQCSLVHVPVPARDGSADHLADREPRGQGRTRGLRKVTRHVRQEALRPARAADRHALDERRASDDCETRLIGAREDCGEARLARSGRTHHRERPRVREHERDAVDDPLGGSASRGARDGQVVAADGDIGIASVRHVLILPCAARSCHREVSGQASNARRWRSRSSSRSRSRITRPSVDAAGTR